MRWWISLAICGVAAAGPVEFGRAEYDAALAARHLKWKATTELNLEPPETFRIEPYRLGGAHITGGDLRGLMYGLLEAADQIRATGRLAQVHGIPAIQTRGIRVFLHPADLEKYPEAFWHSYFELLARNRFNRFNLIFVGQTPYPFLIAVDGFPGVRIAGLTGEQRERNLRRLRFLSQTANDYAIDFTLGIWDEAGESGPMPDGLTRANLAPYSRDALRKLLAACPMIRGVQIQAGSERVGFYRDYIFKALHDAGRRVTLDPRGSLRRPALMKAAEEAGVALRPSSGIWPAGFELDPPQAPEFDQHALFYWLWGQFSYDPKTKPPKGENPDEYRAANEAIHLLIAAHSSDPNMFTWPPANPGGVPEDAQGMAQSDWGPVASAAEAVHNRLAHVLSAKQTPLETADLLTAAAAELDKAPAGDLQTLGRMARYHAHKQRAAYDLELFDQTKDAAALDRAEQELKGAAAAWASPADLLDVRQRLDLVTQRRALPSVPGVEIPALPKVLPRPMVTHTPVKTAPHDQTLTLSLQVASPKEVELVRLHYRTTNPAAAYWVVEKQAEKSGPASFSFTIPAADVSSNWEILYYFEILNREGSGWFEPDPLTTAPYYTISVTAPPP